jgi:hypothetical protein
VAVFEKASRLVSVVYSFVVHDVCSEFFDYLGQFFGEGEQAASQQSGGHVDVVFAIFETDVRLNGERCTLSKTFSSCLLSSLRP